MKIKTKTWKSGKSAQFVCNLLKNFGGLNCVAIYLDDDKISLSDLRIGIYDTKVDLWLATDGTFKPLEY
jgi:hypothetical protein